MTKEKVIEILGSPTSTSENEIQGIDKTEMLHYQIGTLTGCEIYFSNGKVNMKNWTEL